MATTADVAKRAGVSVKTVSRYLSGFEGISQKTIDKIERAAQELEFFPSAAARALRGQASGIISLITDNLTTTPFSFDIVKGIQSVCIANNKLLLIGETQERETIFQQLVERFREQNVEAIIKASFYHKPIEIKQKFERCPLVLVNCFDEEQRYHAVIPDDYQGAKALTEQVIAAGHRKILCLNLPEGMVASRHRNMGFKDAMCEAGLAVDENYINFDNNPGPETTATWLQTVIKRYFFSQLDKPTAIMCSNDKLAFRLIMHLNAAGLSVPSHVSVIGYDDFKLLSENTVPPLSTCALPYYEMGVRAAELAIAMAEGKDVGNTAETHKIPCNPVIRESLATLT